MDSLICMNHLLDLVFSGKSEVSEIYMNEEEYAEDDETADDEV